MEDSVKYVWENVDRDFRLPFISVQQHRWLTQSFVAWYGLLFHSEDGESRFLRHDGNFYQTARCHNQKVENFAFPTIITSCLTTKNAYRWWDSPLPTGECNSSETTLEFWALSAHNLQPSKIVLQMSLHVRYVQCLPKCTLERAGWPHIGEHCGQFIPHHAGNEAVHILCVHPNLKHTNEAAVLIIWNLQSSALWLCVVWRNELVLLWRNMLSTFPKQSHILNTIYLMTLSAAQADLYTMNQQVCGRKW